MRKLLIILLILSVLCGAASAYGPETFEDKTLEQVMDEFMAEYQLTENNFSISFYNTVTGESYDFNEKKFAIAASTYKLPLNMYFYEMEAQGLIDSNAPFRWTGMTLAEVHEASILYSNNEVSEAMTGYWNGNYYIYKENMRKYTDMPLEEIADSYYQTNHSCTRMMMDTLKYLYKNQDQFTELIGYMKRAMPGQYFQAGVQEYEVAHKYGEVDGFINDVAIIYTPQPILLAVYTQGIYGSGVCAQAARLLTDYTVWKAGAQTEVSAEVTEEPEQEPVVLPVEEVEVIPTEQPEEPEQPAENEPVQELPVPEEETRPETVPEETVEPQPQEPEEPEENTKEEEVPRPKVGITKKEKTLWVIVGAGCLLLLAIIPFVLRKRL